MPPRIIIVNRFFFPDESATSQLATDLALYLARRDIACVAITSRQRLSVAEVSLAARELLGDVQIVRVWTTRFGRSGLAGKALDYLTFYLSATWRLLRIASKGDTIVAMTDPPLLSVLCALIARQRRTRLVNWVQDVFPEVAEQLGVIRGRWLLRPLRWCRDASLRAADANVAICERMGELISSIADNVQVISNWALEEGDVDASVLRTQLRLEARFIVGYSGNMGRAHELSTLLDVAFLLKDDPRIVFVFTGDGAQRQALETRASALGLKNVLFRPYQPRAQLRQSLALPDIHVVSLNPALERLIMPSKFVGVIALGRPVLWLGDPAGEIGTLVQVSGCGVVAAADDAVGIAASLTHLASDPDRVTRMSVAASTLWAKSYRRQNALERWRTLLNNR